MPRSSDLGSAGLYSKWTSYYLPLNRWNAKEQLVLTTFLYIFLNHLVLWPSRNNYLYSTHLFLLLIIQEPGRLQSLFYYWKLGNLLVKFHPAVPLFLHHVFPKCILADRLYYIVKTRNLFSRFQVEFCKCRSCEDQITQIVQAAEDGFQKRPIQRSALTLLDFSIVYDTFWREKLLLHMLDTGIPPTLIQWLQ